MIPQPAQNSTENPPGEFLAALFEPADLIELRPLRHDGQPPHGRDWLRRDELARLNGQIAALNKVQSVYFGVNPRNSRGGTAEHVALARCLFVDLDGGATVDHARQSITAAGLPEPTAIVSSGGGVHCYWRLTEPITPAEFTGLQQQLCQLLGGDPKVKDAPRIMRLPGTINRKPERAGARCEVVSLLGHRVELEDIVRCFAEPAQPPPPPPAAACQPAAADAEQRLRRATAYIDKLPPAVSGEGGHDATFRAACEAFRFGLSRVETRLVLDRYNARAQPPWSDRELEHKLTQAEQEVAGAGEMGVRLQEGTHAGERPTPHTGQSNPSEVEPTDAGKSKAAFLTGDALAQHWLGGLRDGFGFSTFPLSSLRDETLTDEPMPLVLGRGLVSVLGGKPGAGKSAMAEQAVFDLLATDPTVRPLIANVELAPAVLIARQITRMTGLSTWALLTGRLRILEQTHARQAFDEIAKHLDRLTIVRTPRRMADIVEAAKATASDVLLLDYLQRLTAGGEDLRQDVSAVMASMRSAADDGRAVLAISALARSKGSKGSTYSGANDLASFRESSEVEYGADFCAIIDQNETGSIFTVVKNRYGALTRHYATFEGHRLRWRIGRAL